VGETASISTAFVTIDRIYLVTGECADQEAARRPQVGAPAEADLAEAAANDARCRVTLRDQPVTQDLRQLASATATLVSDALIPAGHYSQLRFVISGGYITVQDQGVFSTPNYPGLPAGTSVAGELRMPSYAESGLKVDLPGGELVTGAGDHKLLRVDFDIARSFGHEAGASGAWVMHPVLVATDVSFSANLEVTVDATGVPSAGSVQARLEDANHEPTADQALEAAPATTAGQRLFRGQFLYLNPEKSPFWLSLHTGNVVLTTEPATPMAVQLGSGQSATEQFIVTGPNPVQ
jgi:hypothetical protein